MSHNLFRDEIVQACQLLHIPCHELEENRSQTRQKILEAFGVKREYLLQDDLPLATAAIQDPEGWRRLPLLRCIGPFYLFFSKHQDETIFQIETLEQITEILGECTGMVFYVTDQNLKSLIVFSDSNILFMLGDTSPWPF